MSKPYTLKTPCADCPFRSDRPFHLDEARAEEIADSLRGNGGDFYCHKTVDHDECEETPGTLNPSMMPRARVCAGALITLEKEGTSTQMMRIAERLGIYDRTALDMDAPVYDDLDEWVESKRV